MKQMPFIINSVFQDLLQTFRNKYICRVGTSIVQPVNSSGKCRIMPARQILQKSLKWQILAFMNKIELKHPKRFAFSLC